MSIVTSALGGYTGPSSTVALPKSLTFTQFIQTVLVGISGFPGELVRPSWQPNPPKRLDLDVNWLAFGIGDTNPYGRPYIGVDNDGNTQSVRQELFQVRCSVYGPSSLENYRLIRDGFEIPQNLEALTAASMGLVDVSRAIRAPELIDERWFDRWDFTVNMRYETKRTYPVLTFVSAGGTIFAPTATDDNFSVSWLVTG